MPALLAAQAIIGCAITPPTPPDLSGTYVFSRDHYEGDLPVRGLPLLPLRDVGDESLVQVRIEPQASILIEYTDTNGNDCFVSTLLSDDSLTWDDRSIAASASPPGGVPIAPGLELERMRVELHRDCAGQLVVEWSYREYGLALFIIPFFGTSSGKATLEPAPPVGALRTCSWEAQRWVA